MYKLHLIRKYLLKRRIAWVSLVAVMLCTTMVLVVISVMGGWLRMFRASFQGMSGDVIVQAPGLVGFPYYDEIIRKAEDLPEVEAAVPVVRTFGLVNISNQIRDKVIVLGLPIDRIGEVNKFPQSLHRQYEQPVESGRAPPEPSFDLVPGIEYEEITAREGEATWPGMIVGAGLVGIGKDEKGEVRRPEGLLTAWVDLMVLGISADKEVDIEKDKAVRTYWIVDDSRTKIWQYDNTTVYVPFDILQQDLGMAGTPATEDYLGDPARASEIHIKVKPGADLMAVRDKIELITNAVFLTNGVGVNYPVDVLTWEQINEVYLGAVEKEKVLVTFLFAIISVVAIFLIFCIFYMIVAEKTKDIGIIKSVGATNGGVAGIFLGYGLAIGIVGAGLGLMAAWLIVHNINGIHEWLGAQFGFKMWNPEVYAFDSIPNTMAVGETVVIVGVAILSSVLGALVPAARAASMNPVDALRWE